MSQSADDLLEQAVAAVHAGEAEEAKRLLVEVLRADPRSEAAWLWMSAAVETRAERVHCLKQILNINPNHEMAIKGLRGLGAYDVVAETSAGAPRVAPATAPATAPAEPAPPPEAEPATPAHGVPIPTAEAVARAQREVEPIIQAIKAERQPPADTIRWAKPE